MGQMFDIIVNRAILKSLTFCKFYTPAICVVESDREGCNAATSPHNVRAMRNFMINNYFHLEPIIDLNTLLSLC